MNYMKRKEAELMVNSDKTISLAIEKITDRMHELAERSIELDIPYGSMYEGLEEAKKYYIGRAENYQAAKDTLAKRIKEFVDKSIDLDLPLRGSMYDGYKEAMNLLDAAQKEITEKEKESDKIMATKSATITETLISRFKEKYVKDTEEYNKCTISGTIKQDPYFSGSYGKLTCTFRLLNDDGAIMCSISDTEKDKPATKLFESGDRFREGSSVTIEGEPAAIRTQNDIGQYIQCTKVDIQNPVINRGYKTLIEEYAERHSEPPHIPLAPDNTDNKAVDEECL